MPFLRGTIIAPISTRGPFSFFVLVIVNVLSRGVCVSNESVPFEMICGWAVCIREPRIMAPAISAVIEYAMICCRFVILSSVVSRAILLK